MKRSFEEQEINTYEDECRALYGEVIEPRSVRVTLGEAMDITKDSLALAGKSGAAMATLVHYNDPLEVLQAVTPREVSAESYEVLLQCFLKEPTWDIITCLQYIGLMSPEHLDSYEKWAFKTLFENVEFRSMYADMCAMAASATVDFNIFAYLFKKAAPLDGFERVMRNCLFENEYGKAELVRQDKKRYDNSWVNFLNRDRFSERGEKLLAGTLYQSSADAMET